ncbi:MAG: S41 family peptidase [Planctomycetaceae bacterium]|jgi:carboxyl-terminal processing protease|nr:S41 family peptidase [Planctomycetaceae bacterium]
MSRPPHQTTSFSPFSVLVAAIVYLLPCPVIWSQISEQPVLRFVPPVLSTVKETAPNISFSNPDSKTFSPVSDDWPAGHASTKLRRTETNTISSSPMIPSPVVETLNPPQRLLNVPQSKKVTVPQLNVPQFVVPQRGRANDMLPEQPEGNAHSGSHSNLLRTELPPPIPQAELDLVLQHGSELETESRWMDVLSHYETALQIYRNDNKLMERYRTARFHYDVGRRFHDSSYLDIIYKSGFIDTLNFYEEIISRIQKDYVDVPNWDHLFRHGVQDIDIALSDSGFRARANLKTSPEKIDAFSETMRKTVDGWIIRNRDDLKNGILCLAEMAQQQIGLNPTVILMEFICGMVNSLDRYTAYLTPNQLNDQFSLISGNLVGLGVELHSDSESLLIVRVIQGSPAQESGLKDGDRILSVDGISTKGRDIDAADLLQGSEGTVVRLMVKSGLKPVREIQITRRQIDVPSVEDVRMLNNYLGYVKLTGFQSKTGEEMKSALLELDRQGMRCLTLDMRRNPGGLLQIGIEVANLFLDNGVIVRTRGRQNNSDFVYMATPENTWTVPLIVLIDEESASASEIVAGAIRDHKRGVIIGKRSYGKGTIQQILPINSGIPGHARVGLKLTVEKFYSPLGWSYSGVGVSPDIAVEAEKRWSLARPVDGKLQIPVMTKSVSSDPNDPFIRQAIITAQKIVDEK